MNKSMIHLYVEHGTFGVSREEVGKMHTRNNFQMLEPMTFRHEWKWYNSRFWKEIRVES